MKEEVHSGGACCLKQIACVCVTVDGTRVCVCVCVMCAGELVYALSHDKCSLSYNLCASKYDVCEDEL